MHQNHPCLAQRYSPQTLRSNRRLSLLCCMGVLWVRFAFAAPLLAQDIPIPVPDQTIRVEAPPAEVDLTVMVEQLDSAQAAALAAAFAQAAQPGIDMLYQALAQEQEQQGAGTTERIIKTAGWWALGIIALVKLHQIATRDPDVTIINVTHEDGDINIDVPPSEPHDHDHRRKKDDHGEGS